MATALLTKAPARDTAAIISAWIEACILDAPSPVRMTFAEYLGTRLSEVVEALDAK